MATKIRANFVNKAKELVELEKLKNKDDPSKVDFIPHTLRRSYTPKKISQGKNDKFDFRDNIVPVRTKSTTRLELSSDHVELILNAVFIEKLSYQEVADKFKVKKALIGSLVKSK